MSEELRNSLKRLDPMRSAVSTESQTTESSRHRMERVMSTTTHLANPQAQTPKRWVPALASVIVVAVAVGVFVFAGNGTDPAPVAGPPLELSLGDSNVLSSCIIFDVAILRDMPMAFEGTVTAIDGARGTLTVDHWYKGGEAAEVALTGGSADMVSLIGAFPLEVGSSYLITATDGNVNFCGYSGPATPELRSYFEEAFGA